MSELMDVLLADGLRLQERRAVPPPNMPASRADKIIAEGHARRVAYRTMNPSADSAMVYGAQMGYLHGEVRTLAALCDVLAFTRSKEMEYATVTCGDIDAECVVGYSYTEGEDSQTSGPPENCHEGAPDELEISEVWINGAELSAALRDDILSQIEAATLERVHALQAKGREEDDCL